jgi:alkylation response protein AidB-like acyl-CoA dehydrogenase
MARVFVEKCVATEAPAWDRDAGIPSDFLLRMAQQGFLGMIAPSQYGGSAVEPVAYALALMEIAAASPSLALVMSISNVFCDTIHQLATEEQKQRMLPDHVAGGHIPSIAITEPQAGSNASAIETSAKRVEAGYVLNGTKIYVTNGKNQGRVMVFARTSDDRRTGLTCFLVDKGTKGASHEVMETTLGLRAVNMTEMRFADCFVAEEDLLGEEGSGFEVIQQVLGIGRVGIGSQCVGIARGAYRLALQHVKTREQFGGPLAKLQAVQISLADMATEIDAAELLTLRAAALRAEGKPHDAESAMAKLFASEMACRVTDKALQLHGGAGYFESSPLARFYADARATRIYEGTSEIMRVLIARALYR